MKSSIPPFVLLTPGPVPAGAADWQPAALRHAIPDQRAETLPATVRDRDIVLTHDDTVELFKIALPPLAA